MNVSLTNLSRPLVFLSLIKATSILTQGALQYVRKLTENPAQVTDADINSLRENGWSDGEILEINQVSAYFAYANRTVLGLGINTDGEFLGLSPGDSVDAENWKHH